MDYIFEEWKNLLSDFAAKAESVDTKLEEIRKCREDIQNIKTEIFNAIAQGYYLRDDRRIILSAPEIIIGDVDKDGHLWMNNSHSKVIIRSNDIYIDGVASGVSGDEVSDGSTIMCRANNIIQAAVDPGPSGNEYVVSSKESNILTLGKAVKIGTIDTDGVIIEDDTKIVEGVEIHSNKTLKLDASVSDVKKKDSLKEKKDLLAKQISALKKDQKEKSKTIEKKLKEIKTLYDNAAKLKGTSVENVRSNAMEILDCRQQIERLLPSLYDEVNKYTSNLEDLSDANRETKAINNALDGNNNQDFLKTTTGACIAINSEQVNITTEDGDGNHRSNTESGISCNANHVQFIAEATVNNKIEFQKDSYFLINSNKVEFIAADQSFEPQNKKYTLEPTGQITMYAKNFQFDSTKFEETNAENQEPKHTILDNDPTNSLIINVPSTKIIAEDKVGNAIGAINLNAKEITISTVDEKNEGKDKTIAKDSKIEVVSENLNVGKLGENTSKTATLDTEKLSVSVKELADMKQDGGKSAMKMSEGKIEVKAENGVDETGALTVNSETTFKADVTGKGGKFDSLQASSSLNGPHLKD